MTLPQSVILAIVQGITEFLPISSDGHLNLVQFLMSLTPSLSFDIFLNTATLLSVLYYFRHSVTYFFKNLNYIIVASIPAGIVGIFFKSLIASISTRFDLLPFFFLITTVYLFASKFAKGKDSPLTYKKAFIIGIFQALAILPAVSRSGGTIAASLLLGLAPSEAFKFSFSIFIPVSLGALLLDLRDSNFTTFLSPNYLIAFVVSFFVGLIALKWLQKIVSVNRLWYFGIYTLLLTSSLLIFR